MSKSIPLRPVKFHSGFLKGFLILLGVFFLVSGIAALLLSFIAFWDAACDACGNVACSSTGHVINQGDMDWTFLWLDAYFFFGVIVGPILLANSSSMISKRSYLKAYPYAVFCPNCGTLCDKRGGRCPSCGLDVDPDGLFKNMNIPAMQNLDSTNPYSSYWQNKAKNEQPPQDPKDIT
ncbi:MAG: zinc ribbon domain-containing protein [Clostridia bacterium]|nr:zinc ribbon domain-containing protein [Clostridia bacterium]